MKDVDLLLEKYKKHRELLVEKIVAKYNRLHILTMIAQNKGIEDGLDFSNAAVEHHSLASTNKYLWTTIAATQGGQHQSHDSNRTTCAESESLRRILTSDILSTILAD